MLSTGMPGGPEPALIGIKAGRRRLRRERVPQQAQPFEPERLGVDRLVDVAVRGLDVGPPCGAEGGHRAAAGAPVAPGAVAAAGLLGDREVLRGPGTGVAADQL